MTWLLQREADGLINVFEVSKYFFPLLTVREPPFEEALDWLQFAYTADQAGAYVDPESTVLAHSAVAKWGGVFPLFPAHLRRLYPEVYGPAVPIGRVPARREFRIVEGGELSGENRINSSKLGAYAGIFNHIKLAGMNKSSPNLTTVYLDTPLVGLTPEPLEYAPSTGRLGQPRGYLPIRTRVGPHTGGSKRRPPPPPRPYSTPP